MKHNNCVVCNSVGEKYVSEFFNKIITSHICLCHISNDSVYYFSLLEIPLKKNVMSKAMIFQSKSPTVHYWKGYGSVCCTSLRFFGCSTQSFRFSSLWRYL